MSKTSKPRDRWHQVFAAATDRRGFCIGCGYYYAVHDEHRADCTRGKHTRHDGTTQ